METHIFKESKRRFEPLNNKCSFCKTGAHSSYMEDNCFSSVYKTEDRTNLLVYRNVKFNEVKIGIPRCAKCRRVHSMAKTASYITLFVGIPLVFIIPIWICVEFDLPTIGMGILLVITFGLVYLAMKAIENAILNAYTMESEKDGALKEPLVREFLRIGWSLDRPRA